MKLTITPTNAEKYELDLNNEVLLLNGFKIEDPLSKITLHIDKDFDISLAEELVNDFENVTFKYISNLSPRIVNLLFKQGKVTKDMRNEYIQKGYMTVKGKIWS